MEHRHNQDDSKKYTWGQLTIIQASGFASIPALLFGYILAKTYGLYGAVANIIVAHIILLILAIPLTLGSIKHKQNSPMQSEEVLGLIGNKIAMLGVIISLIGWFGVELNLASKAIMNIMPDGIASPGNTFWKIKLLNLAIGICIILVTKHGIDRIKRFAKVSSILFLPTLALTFTCFAANFKSLMFPPASNLLSLITTQACLFAIAGSVGVIFDLATFYRFSSSKRDGLLSVCLVFGICFPAIEICGAFLQQIMQQEDLITALTGNNLHYAARAWNAIFIVFSMCALNNTNLYAAVIDTEALTPSLSFKARNYLIGALGILLACTDPADSFVFTLDKMLVVIAAITPLMVLKATVLSKVNHTLACLAVVIGSIIGLLGAIEATHMSWMSDFTYFNAAAISTIVYITLDIAAKVLSILLKISHSRSTKNTIYPKHFKKPGRVRC